MMPLFIKKPLPPSRDNLLKTVSLYLIFAGLLLQVVAGMSWGMWGAWGTWLPLLSLRWFVAGVAIAAAGCLGLWIHDIQRLIRKMCRKQGPKGSDE